MQVIKKYVICYICFMIMLMCSSLSVSAKEQTDIVPSPVLITDFKMNMYSAQPGDVLEYSFTLTDVGIKQFCEEYGTLYGIDEEYDGMYMIKLYWSSPDKQKICHTVVDYSKGDDKESDSWNIEGKVPVKKGMQQGKWTLSQIRFLIFANEGAEITIEDIRSGTSPVLMDFSMADFTVSGTGKADNKAPTIVLKSLKTSKRYVKKNQKSTFSVKVKDQSTIKKVRCDWLIYDDRYAANWEWTSSYKMKYNKKKKRYQCSVTLNGEPEEKAALYQIYVEDIYGNKAIYRADLDTYHYQKRTRRYYNAYRKMIVIVK